jgi:hypothetical protein
VDRLLFPDNGPSAERLVPEWQDLTVGDPVPDGAPDKHTAFLVAELEPNRHLVLHSREHLPPHWEERYGAAINWSWQFVLDEIAEDQTRFIVRSRLRLEPQWVEAFYIAVIVPADFIMSRQMLHGVKQRAERTTSDDLTALVVA